MTAFRKLPRAKQALRLRQEITRIVIEYTSWRISDDEYFRRCEAVWDRAARLGLTRRLQDNWMDTSLPYRIERLST